VSDTVTFEIPPLNVRLRAVAVLAVSIALQVYALTSAPWFTAKFGDETYVVELGRVRDMPQLVTHETGGQMVVMLLLFVASFACFVRGIYLGITVLLGHPIVRRGLFRTRLMVAYKTPFRAHIFTAIATVLAAAYAYTLPQLALRDSFAGPIPGVEMAHSWGGAMLVVAFVIAHVAIHLVARDPQLAATQMWGDAFEAPAYESAPALAKPARRERPMIKSPLPPAPTNVVGTPFREAGAVRGSSLEDLVVRPARPATSPEVKPPADGTGEEPSLLR